MKSLLDHPEDSGAENEMRYKLIIDSSEDGLLVRLLFSTGVLLRDKTRIYMCSDFPGDSQLQNVCYSCMCREEVFTIKISLLQLHLVYSDAVDISGPIRHAQTSKFFPTKYSLGLG